MENEKLNDIELEKVTGGISAGSTKLNSENAPMVGRGKTGKPTLVLWDEASAGLIADPEHPGSGKVGDLE